MHDAAASVFERDGSSSRQRRGKRKRDARVGQAEAIIWLVSEILTYVESLARFYFKSEKKRDATLKSSIVKFINIRWRVGRTVLYENDNSRIVN